MNTNKKIGIIILAIFIIAFFIANNNFKDLELERVKAELLEAQKPSQIEIQKKELEDLEEKWQELEKSCQQKPEIEIKIREKRNEILGLKK